MSNVVRKEGPKPELESARQTASATTQLLLHLEPATVDLAAPHRTLWATKTARVKAQVTICDRFQLSVLDPFSTIHACEDSVLLSQLISIFEGMTLHSDY